MKNLLELSHIDAQLFFLKSESYCSLDLPPYFDFSEILGKVNIQLDSNTLKSLRCETPRNYDDVNHSILTNKDGKYAWRPIELIHPALYVSLINEISSESNWNLIKTRFSQFNNLDKIKCLSIPVVSESHQTDKATQILYWWQSIEQKSIELYLEYEYLVETDITDCYGSIYSHSISWALHGKEEAKKKENRDNDSFIGVVIDNHIRDMRNGQTNGIPQGSVLMDFIAEMVLGYGDLEISKKISENNIVDYFILRYRDDYRIFVNNPQEGEAILKIITEVMIDLGLKLNSQKTNINSNIIKSSIKKDKIAWLKKKQFHENIQKYSLLIYDHSLEYPNSGSLVTALNDFLKELIKIDKNINDAIQIIAIFVDIMEKNPKSHPLISAILSKLFTLVDNTEIIYPSIIKILKKIRKIPNTGYAEIWVQRFTLLYDEDISYSEKLCELIYNEDIDIWNNDWISSPKLKRVINSRTIIKQDVLRKLEKIISLEEVELFVSKSTKYY